MCGNVHVRVCRSMEVSMKAAWVVMNYIDFRGAVECFFRSDIIRTEKLYKIAVVLTIKIKKYLCTHWCSLPINALLWASKCSKFGKVWLWSQLPHNTWSLISQRTRGEWKRKKIERSTPSHNFHYDHIFFLFMSRSTLSGNLRLQRHYSLFLFPVKSSI